MTDYAERCDEVADQLGLIVADSQDGEGFTFYDDAGAQQTVGHYLLTKLESLIVRHASEVDDLEDEIDGRSSCDDDPDYDDRYEDPDYDDPDYDDPDYEEADYEEADIY